MANLMRRWRRQSDGGLRMTRGEADDTIDQLSYGGFEPATPSFSSMLDES